MQYIDFGNIDLKVSCICLDCMRYAVNKTVYRLDKTESRPFIQRFLELGISFLDIANMYPKIEMVLGRALWDFAKRNELVITTKVFYPMRTDANASGLSRKTILTEIAVSLNVKSLLTKGIDSLHGGSLMRSLVLTDSGTRCRRGRRRISADNLGTIKDHSGHTELYVHDKSFQEV